MRVLGYIHCCKNLTNPPKRLGQKTPLQCLALHNQSEHVRTFLDLGAEVNAEAGPVQGATAFQFAAMNGNFKIADMLIKAGADINAPSAAIGGRSTIEGAAEWGRLDMVHYLLEIGADINDQRNYRRTVYRA
jgi:ankyrin repeat protein